MRFAIPLTLLRTVPVLMIAMLSSACSPVSSSRGPTRIDGSSQTLKVTGEYAPVAIDRIDRLTLAGSTLVLHGSSISVTVPLPGGANQPKTGDQWVLVTEGKAADGRRTVTFTHEQSLDDFTMSLPSSDAELRYGTLSGKSGEDLLVFAWGKDSRSYWGYVTIRHA